MKKSSKKEKKDNKKIKEILEKIESKNKLEWHKEGKEVITLFNMLDALS